MTDISPNGQDLAKALDTTPSTDTGNPAQAFSSTPSPQPTQAEPQAQTPTASTGGGNPDYAPIVPPNSPLASATMQSSPAQDNSSNTPTDAQPASQLSSAYSAYAPQPASTDSTASSAPVPASDSSSVSTAPSAQASGPLEDIKKEALDQLRPLVGKLGVEPQEKFDTYLLLIRSTDDKELIAPAYDAAKAIPDEAKKAEALLDIIKEIDYLSHPKSS